MVSHLFFYQLVLIALMFINDIATSPMAKYWVVSPGRYDVKAYIHYFYYASSMGWGTSFGSDLWHALNLCLSCCYVTPRVTPFAQTHPYERHGTRNLFLFVEPQAGRRHVHVTEQRTKVDFAH